MAEQSKTFWEACPLRLAVILSSVLLVTSAQMEGVQLLGDEDLYFAVAKSFEKHLIVSGLTAITHKTPAEGKQAAPNNIADCRQILHTHLPAL